MSTMDQDALRVLLNPRLKKRAVSRRVGTNLCQAYTEKTNDKAGSPNFGGGNASRAREEQFRGQPSITSGHRET